MRQRIDEKKEWHAKQTGRRILAPLRYTFLPLFFLLLAALTAALAGPLPARAMMLSNTPCRETWVTNGPVKAIARTSDTVYLGGEFSYVGPHTGSGVPLDAATGKPLSSFPKVDGTTCACVADGQGGWFIGGDFMHVGHVSRNQLAHILKDGTLDPAWNPDARGTVEAMALSGGVLYVGGYFASIGGQARNNLAALDAASGAVTAWNPGADNLVHALAVSGGVVYAGGNFLNIGGQARSHLAALDAATGAATAWNPWNPDENFISDDHSVNALAVANGVVYVGGCFVAIGGQRRFSLAALDPVTGTATAWEANAFKMIPYDQYMGSNTLYTRYLAHVLTLAVSEGVVYVGGDFDEFGGEPSQIATLPGTRSGLAALDATTGAVIDKVRIPYADGRVYALTASKGMLYAGMDCNHSSGEPKPDNKIIALNAATSGITAWDIGANKTVYAMAVSDNMVYVGGSFTSIGGQKRSGIAALDAATGAATAWNPNASYNGYGSCSVNALAVLGGTVYVGGSFTSIGGQNRNGIATLDTATGTATAWDPYAGYNGYGPCSVDTLVLLGGTVYIGGNFSSIGGQARNRIAALDATTGAVTAWNPNVSGEVNTLAVSGGVVYASGWFSIIGGQTRNNLAALDATTGNAMAWNPDANSRISTLALADGAIYASGWFNTIGGQNRSGLAALDRVAGTATPWRADNGISPSSSSTPAVEALAVSGDRVYAGGVFTSIGGQTRNRLAALDATTGAATAWNPGADSDVRALAASDSTVYVGGDFTNIGGQSRTGFAQFNAFNAVTYATDGTPGATLSGTTTQAVEPGSNATAVIAIAPTGYHFTKWTEDGEDYATANPLTVTGVTEDQALVAHFTLDTYTITFRTDGLVGAALSGVTAQSMSINETGTAVKATPPVGYHFVNWTNGAADYSMANPLTVSGVTGDLALVAHFAPNQYAVSFQTNGIPGATLSGARRQTVLHGANVAAVKALPPAGYHFTKWTLGGRYYTIANPITVKGVTANMTLTAVFVINSYTVSFQTDGRRGATLSGLTRQTINYGAGGATVKANAPAGYRFAKWTAGSRNYAYSNPLTVAKVTANMALVANFAPIQYTISFKTDGTRGATLSGSQTQTVNAGASATAVKAVAPRGYRFVKWTKGGAGYSTANPLTVTKVTTNMTLVANFKKK